MLKVATILIISLFAISPFLVISHNNSTNEQMEHFDTDANYKIRKVVIDAGHGGKDPGCSGRHTREKDITLAIAKKLGVMIDGYYKKEGREKVEVIYTRYRDVFVPLNERANIANKQKADLFISIHCNASRSGASGTETYVMGLNKSSENLEVVQRENAVITLEDDYEHKYDYDPKHPANTIMLSLFQNAYLDQSIRFAQLVESEFKAKTQRKSRGVKQESFLVLYKTAMPSVLIETGFLTNSKEETLLKSKEGQAKIATSIFKAFKSYKNSMEDEGAYCPIEENPFEDMVYNLQSDIYNELTICEIEE